MRAFNVTFAILLAIMGSLGCTSNSRLYNRSAATAAQAPSTSAAAKNPANPAAHPTAKAPGDAGEPAAIVAPSSPADLHEQKPAVAATPLETSSAIPNNRAVSPEEKNPTPEPSQPVIDQSDTNDRWADLLEKDLDNAVGQPLERRRILFSREVVDHPKIRHFIQHYSSTVKSSFKELLTRSGKYMPMIAKVLNQEGLPQELGYLALIESEFIVNTTSPNGAVGLWQLIASTARKYGLRIDRWVDERRDPVKATRAAAAYLKDLHDYYGRWFLATAAYNAGPGNIDKALRQSKAKDFWSIKANARLSDETRDFVPKFVAISLIANDPHKYGFHEVRYNPPMDYEEVEVRGKMNLAVLAKLSETAVPELRALNPALLRDSTPPGEKGYRIKLPAEKAAIFLAKRKKKLREDDPQQGRTLTHEVKKGETLFSIARLYGLTVRALMHFNDLTRSQLRIGQKLKILLEGLGRTLR
jgi:hypothetical protein